MDPCAINTGSVAVVVVDGGSCGCCCFLLLAQHLVRQTLSSSSKRTENERVSISSSIRKDFVEPSIVLHVKHPRLMVENVVNGIQVGRIVTAATKHYSSQKTNKKRTHDQSTGFLGLKTTKRKRNGSRKTTKSPHDQQTTHQKWTRAANQIYTNTEHLATSLQSCHLPETQGLRKCF